jgi:tubulin polyglutamylase TTLL4
MVYTDEGDFNGFWGGAHAERLKNLNRFQKINHFPGCWNLGRKDYLWKNLSKMKRKWHK